MTSAQTIRRDADRDLVEIARSDGTPSHRQRASLERALAERVRGEVRFARGDLALYATDSSNYRQVPIGVVIPRDVDDMVTTVEIARTHEIPLLTRGGGTSLAGQGCNAALLMDTSKYVHHVLEIDPSHRIGRVQPGTVLDDLRRAANVHGLTFGPDPSTHNHCTLGGMLGNDSCGVHSVLSEFYGPGPRTADNLESLEILTYAGVRMRVGPTSENELSRIIAAGGRRGELYAQLRALRDRYANDIRTGFPKLLRRVSGYNLDQLLPEHGFNVARALVGSEGTCVTILEASLILVPEPRERVLLVLGYPSVYDAGDDVPHIREFKPIGLEGLDHNLVEYMEKKGLHTSDIGDLPSGKGWLLVEFGGDTTDEAEARARDAMDALQREPHAPSMKLYTDPGHQRHLWTVRESGLGATAFVPGERDTWEGWEDSAVPVEGLGGYLRDLRALFEKYGYACALYGHFGQGCVHTRIDFGLTSEAGIAKYRDFTREAAELVCHKYHGSLSGEHGDGQSRGDLLPIMFGEPLMRAFREFKAVWDPDGRMNPGKKIDAAPRTAHLRLGANYAPAQPRTHFKFPEDGTFAHAALRCVGVGECRREQTGTICPSYRVLREEKHSTRGRAHLLFEMLRGEVITDGWRSEAVKESLDCCLACKGCKGDCPVNVDVATYKAEFLSHYYAGRLRPRSAYAFGLIMYLARLASRFPQLANLMTHAPGVAALTKWAMGMAPERQVPRFAPRTFTEWFRSRPRPPNVGAHVVLWPDTFNDHFFPSTLFAALEVLESTGCAVELPRDWLCCGRPLYDFGMLDLAEHRLRRALDTLQPEIEAGTPIIGLEPSCVAVFRDELMNLLPKDPRAKRLSGQVVTLGEFLVSRNGSARLPHLEGRAMVHGHCHQKAIMKMGSEARVLDALGLDYEVLDSGCCGMAGSFGFEAGKYDLSVAIGERVLLPAVRNATPDTLIIADGFSCREQISQLTGRRALHLAEVVQLALHQDTALGDGAPAERRLAQFQPRALTEYRRPPAMRTLAAGAGAVALGLVARHAYGRRRARTPSGGA